MRSAASRKASTSRLSRTSNRWRTLLHHDLADSDAGPSEEIQILLVLDVPTGSLKLLIDEHTGALLRSEAPGIV